MSEVSKQALMQAAELLGCSSDRERIKLAVASFIQQASDACKLVVAYNGDARCADSSRVSTKLAPFILSDPVDPLPDILRRGGFHGDPECLAAWLREDLAKNGLAITEVSA